MDQKLITNLIKDLNEIKKTIDVAIEDLNQERGLSEQYTVSNLLDTYFNKDYDDILEDYNQSTGE